MLVNVFGADDNGAEVTLSIQSPTPDGPAIVQAGTTASGELWMADAAVYQRAPDLPEGVGASLEVDGSRITGSGTFFEERSLSAALQVGGTYETGVRAGSFEVTCPIR